MNDKIHLVTVASTQSVTLAAMLRHYSRLNIASRHVILHSEDPDTPTVASARAVVEATGATLDRVVVMPWSLHVNPLLYRMMRMDRTDEWFVIADCDEFHEYPVPIEDIVNFCERHGFDYVEGCFVDRIASDGRLKPINDAIDIGQQFPLGCCLTGIVLGAVINKVVIAKGHVRLSGGQHHSYSGRGCPISEFYIPVNHYKWTEGLTRRLKSRITTYKTLHEPIGSESEAFCRYYEQEGRIRLEDPKLMVGYGEPCYSYWSQLKEWRSASELFRRF